MRIAIDGPAASGKGTLARNLAHHYHLKHLDTGLLYRALGYLAINRGIALDDAPALAMLAREIDLATMDHEALRQDAIAHAASCVSQYGEVRAALRDYQREFAKNASQTHGGAILDGRDIGTVILPDADIKFFIIADLESRAHRRHEDLLESHPDLDFQTVLADMQRRDARDQGRTAAPLKAAADAITINTSNRASHETLAYAIDCITTHQERARP